MINAVMNGVLGRMGQMIVERSSKNGNVRIVAGVDAALGSGDAAVAEAAGKKAGTFSFPVCADLHELKEQLKEQLKDPVDVIIDFSTASGVDSLLDHCVASGTPLVLCTTGLSEQQLRKVSEASESIPVLRSANMSVGVNMMMKLLKQAAAVFADSGFDIEIVEKHHNKKLDAPSGTAIALADSINSALPEPYEYVYDRSGRRELRPEKEIGISAVRGGSIVGEHDVIFAGEDEVFTVSHQAYSRAIFANGAIKAAEFLAGRKPGMYSMDDVL